MTFVQGDIRRLTATAAVLVVVAASAASCTGSSADPSRRADKSGRTKDFSHAKPVQLAVIGDRAGTVSWKRPLALSAVHGRLLAVTVRDGFGHVLRGTIAPGARRWTSAPKLVPSTTYAGTVRLRNGAGKLVARHFSTQASGASEYLDPLISPGDGTVVGVGMPVIVQFNRDVPLDRRAAVAKRMKVTSKPSVKGAWHWFDATTLHWRPKTYWPAHTNVHVDVNLDRLHVGGDLWGRGRHTSDYSIGDSHVSVVDVNRHTMTVKNNGHVVRTLPMSAGRARYPTHAGVHLALERNADVVMDSATIGIPRNNPNGYYEHVAWDVRISYSGEFVHAAPWSTAEQGSANVSHGCVNLSTDNARWFYGFTRRGDVIDVVDGGQATDVSDPGTADWNIPWLRWANS